MTIDHLYLHGILKPVFKSHDKNIKRPIFLTINLPKDQFQSSILPRPIDVNLSKSCSVSTKMNEHRITYIMFIRKLRRTDHLYITIIIYNNKLYEYYCNPPPPPRRSSLSYNVWHKLL